MNSKLISFLLIISVLINIGLSIYISKNNKNHDRMNESILSRADIAIDNAVNISAQIVGNWDKLSEEELIQQLGNLETEFAVAMELMNMARTYFYPVKNHREQSKVFIDLIIEKGKTEQAYNKYKKEYDEILTMWNFLAENQIVEIGIDEVILRWEELN